MTDTPPTSTSHGSGNGIGTGQDWRPRARRATAWSTAAGLVLLLAALVVVWSWRDSLPTRVASHWSGGGTPDGFSSLAGFALLLGVVGAGLLALFATIGLVAGAPASTRRLAAAGSVWSGAFMAGILLCTIAPQRGLTDASHVALPGWGIALTVAGSLVLAVTTALLVPGDPAQPAREPVAADATRATLGDGERAVWIRRATGGPGLAVGMGAILVTASLAVVLQTWVALVVPALLAVLFLAMFSFTVRVDATGLSVRSTLGWPGTHVPADEVVASSVIEVRPFTQFGGWGWRVGRGGRVGVVLRGGEALLVERTGGRSLVVTVDDAATGAALLNTLADRARARN